MQLDEAQRQKVAAWVAEGLKLSEIQTRLASELGVKLTYMEARFLVDDLKLTLKDPEPPKTIAPIGGGANPPANPPGAVKGPAIPAQPLPEALSASGKVSITVDQVTRPGAIVSGKVTFSDGQVADWYLDQMGRLGVVPKQQGYKPSATDVQQFQLALEGEMAKLGY
jgi:hypothetical protein